MYICIIYGEQPTLVSFMQYGNRKWLQFGQCSIPLPAETRDYSLLEKFRPALRPTWSPILRVPGAILPGPKHPGHEHDHPFSSSAKVKNG